MTRWQRRARLLVAVFVIGFAALLLFAFKRRPPAPVPVSTGRTDPNAVVESTSGQSFRFKGTHEDVRVAYDKQLTYKDGSTRLIGVKVVTTERGGARTFTVSAKEGLVGQNESTLTMNGDVNFAASDGLTAKTEHATYTESDGMLRAPGPVEFTRGRLSGTGIGMTYDKNQDILVIVDQAHIQMPGGQGTTSTEITAPTATLARRDKYARFERGIKARRGGQILEAESSVAHLSDDGERVESIELRGHSTITSSKSQPGGLQSLTGRDMDLKYGPDGETLEHAVITGDASLHLAGGTGSSGRRITANIMDITLAPDGTTPVALIGRESVQLVFPAEQGGAARTIKAMNLEARGDAMNGLTSATFTGASTPGCLDRRTAGPDCDVDFRESDAGGGRAAKAGSLDVSLKPGMSAIEEAKFSRNVRFEEAKLGTVAAAARYLLDKGTLELSGSEPGALRPHLVTEQITIDANRVDVTLAGPKMKASGAVQSVLQPKPKDQKSESKTPSMLKGDQAVNIVGDDLDYDGGESKAVYKGHAKLWQTDTTVQGQTLALDNKNGDITASGLVTTTAMLEQSNKDGAKQKRERVRSVGTAQEFKYEESMRRATYSREAHLSGPQGDMSADKIELYLLPSGNEVDRAEAYADQGKLTLREQKRKTSGARLTYTTANDTYVVTGTPVTIADECGSETVGRKLTFIAGTDTVIIESEGRGRTQTRSTGQCLGK
jgi:LPS export ABC transporter protein LptC